MLCIPEPHITNIMTNHSQTTSNKLGRHTKVVRKMQRQQTRCKGQYRTWSVEAHVGQDAKVESRLIKLLNLPRIELDHE
jgi:hypothetical protein